MPLQIIFGDDEHTAKDGTYNRLIRARKWLYVSAGAATVLALGLYDAKAAISLLKVVSLPSWLLTQLVMASLAYLLVQYALLLFQLVVTYDLVLSERLAFRRADELSSATDRFARARAELIAAQTKFNADAQTAFGMLEQELVQTRAMERKAVEDLALPINALSPQADKVLADLERRASIATNLRENSEQKIETLSGQLRGAVPVPELESLRQAVAEAGGALEHLRRQNPADRPGYAHAERIIDFARLVPPCLFAALAMIGLIKMILVPL